ncbi:unnamed protein product [Dibothriocephalus latus]|uniref:Uncharacterized protein n=1 Tax=Dibothriocephalus latus TaxID=60516 RepID=A0A3P7RKC4_DIBLA|nr:unnamed protein product [Dibothriocephalus latus]
MNSTKICMLRAACRRSCDTGAYNKDHERSNISGISALLNTHRDSRAESSVFVQEATHFFQSTGFFSQRQIGFQDCQAIPKAASHYLRASTRHFVYLGSDFPRGVTGDVHRVVITFASTFHMLMNDFYRPWC